MSKIEIDLSVISPAWGVTRDGEPWKFLTAPAAVAIGDMVSDQKRAAAYVTFEGQAGSYCGDYLVKNIAENILLGKPSLGWIVVINGKKEAI